MHKTERCSCASYWKCWWLDNSRSQELQWHLRISKQWSICSRGAGPRLLNGSQTFSCKNKNFHKNPREACKSFWSPTGNLKSFTLTIPWNSVNLVKIFPGIIARLHHRDKKQMGLLKEQCAEWKEGTSAVLLQSGLNESWWAESVECYTNLRKTSQIRHLMGRRPMKDVLGQLFQGQIIPLGSLDEYHPTTAKDQSRIHQFGKKVLPGLFLGYALYAGWNFGRVTYLLQTLRSWRRWTHRKSTQKDSMRKRWYFPKEEGEYIFQS